MNINPDKIKFNMHTNHNPACDILCYQIDTDTTLTYGIYVTDGPGHVPSSSRWRKGDEFCELYIGENYNINSTKKSYSRCYERVMIPKKHRELWSELRKFYREYTDILQLI